MKITSIALMGAALCVAPSVLGQEPIVSNLPMILFENPGTLGDSASFVGHRSGMASWLAQDGFSVRFADRTIRGEEPTFSGATLRYQFLGANPATELRGESELPGTVNLLLGNDPAAWAPGLRTFDQVRYVNMYDGVDVIVHGMPGVFTYDLSIQPGVDPSVVRIRCEGADSLTVDANGSLIASTANGEVRQSLPVTWRLAEDGSRQPVESRFVLHGDGTYGFAVDGDPSAGLLIDPGLTWSTYLGGGNQDGSGDEHGCGVDVDDDCAAYVAGDTLSLNFPVTNGAFQTVQGGDVDAFVAKIVGSGNTLLFSTFIGGAGGDFGHGIAVDQNFFSYVTGGTTSANLPVTGGAFDTTYNGQGDMFVAKLSPGGTTLSYCTYIGGNDVDASLGAHGIEVDNQGIAYITGETASTDYPTTAGAFATVHGGGFRDVFATKLSPDGSALLYSTFIGGNGPGISDSGTSISLDTAGNAYVVGLTTSQNFPTTPGVVAPNPPGSGSNGFLCKIAANGNSLSYSTFIGGTGDVARSVSVNSTTGVAYAVGFTASTVFPTTPGAFDTSSNGFGDGWITVLDPNAASLVYSSYIGGADIDVGNAVDVDDQGHAYISGWTQSSNFPTTANAFDKTHHYNGPFPSGNAGQSGAEDVFLTRISPNGSQIQYSTYIGGADIDVAYAINVHEEGAVYIAGGTRSLDFPTTLNAVDQTYNGVNGDQDVFLILMPAGAEVCPAVAASAPYGQGKAGKYGVPSLSMTAEAIVGQVGTMKLSNASENSVCALLIGNQTANTAFNGGTILVNPFFVSVAATDGLGELTFNYALDENPNFCGTTLYAQAILNDPTVFLFSMSNGLSISLGY